MTNRMNDSCGCAMGAVFTVVGLLTASIVYGWQLYARQLPLYSTLLRILVVTVCAAGCGKLIGIWRHRVSREQISFHLLSPSATKKGI
jgi:hypothetical protein